MSTHTTTQNLSIIDPDLLTQLRAAGAVAMQPAPRYLLSAASIAPTLHNGYSVRYALRRIIESIRRG